MLTLNLILALLVVALLIELVYRRWIDRRNCFYRVYVEWGNDGYTHRAETLAEAHEWLKAYPAAAWCKIDKMYYGRARFVASRRG